MASESKKTNFQKNKVFRGKIGRKLTISMLFIALLPLFIAGFIAFPSSEKILVSAILDKLEVDARIHASELNSVLNRYGERVLFLSNIPPIQGIVRAQKNNGVDPLDGSTYQDWIERLETIFEQISRADKSYLQVRYIDENGQELIRVNSDGTNYFRVATEGLQNKSGRYYFINTMNIGYGEVYVSPFDLNREGAQSEIQVPYQPVIRYSTPIFDEATNERKGILIINVVSAPIFDTFHEFSDTKQIGEHGDSQEFLVDKEGYYFLHQNKEKEWGSPRDLNTGENIKNDLPDNMSTLILSGEAGTIEMQEHGHMLAYYPVYPNIKNQEEFWVVFEIVPRKTALAPVLDLRNTLLWIVCAFTLVVIIFSLIFARSLSKPIGILTDMAKALTTGDLSVRNKIKLNNELGILSVAFNEMADNIVEARTNIEKKVLDRTKKLEKLNDSMVGRELKMIKLKKEIKDLRTNKKDDL